MAKRKRFTKEFKAKVAIEALKGQRSLQELAKEFGVHAQQIGLWKKQLLDSVPEVFGRGAGKEIKEKERELDLAYRQVGQLKVEGSGPGRISGATPASLDAGLGAARKTGWDPFDEPEHGPAPGRRRPFGLSRNRSASLLPLLRVLPARVVGSP